MKRVINEIEEILDLKDFGVDIFWDKNAEVLGSFASGAYNFKENRIYLKKPTPKEEQDNMYVFELVRLLAHELRHAYQFKNDKYYTKNFKVFQDCKSIKDYNNQKYEVDAEAFGVLIEGMFFIKKNLFLNDLDVTLKLILEGKKDLETIKKIKKQIKKLLKDETLMRKITKSAKEIKKIWSGQNCPLVEKRKEVQM